MNNQPRVQKKNKKSKLTGYTLFAKESSSGVKVKLGDEVFVSASEIKNASGLWEQLPESKKEKYKSRAKELNIKISTTSVRYNSMGVDLQEIEAKNIRKNEKSDARKEEIQRIIKDQADIGELDTQQFFFVSTSHFYQDASSVCPAELALAKYSLKEGIISSTSIKINPGKLPLGSTFTAQSHAQETHKYPLPDGEEEETDYIEVLTMILDFIAPLDEIPIFFTEGHSDIYNEDIKIEHTQKVLIHICDKAGEYKLGSNLKVYSIYELLYYLKKQIVEIKEQQDNLEDAAFNSVNYAYEKYKKTDSDLAYKTKGCEYHDEKDVSMHCCLSKVIRNGLIISKWCCQSEKYPLLPGRHF